MMTLVNCGYFDSPAQTEPAFDPGRSAPCPACGEPWTPETVRTMSLMWEGDNRSYFYRVHRACDDAMTDEERARLDAVILDAVRGVACRACAAGRCSSCNDKAPGGRLCGCRANGHRGV